MAKVGGTDPMEAQQKGFRVTQAPSREDLGPITSRPQAAKQAGFGSPFERGIKGEGAGTLQLLAESTTGEQQGHRNQK